MLSHKKANTKTPQPGHRLVTRRDFLAQGLLGTATFLFPASPLLSLCSEAQAQTTGKLPSLKVPFVVFDLVGGAALPGNFLAGKQGGAEDLLKSYDRLGWDPRQSGALDRRFGAPMAGKDVSKILAGILATTSPAAQAGLRFGTICHKGQDDSSINQHSAVQEVTSAGLSGRFIQKPLSLANTSSGGNSRVPNEYPRFKATPIYKLDDVLDSARLTNHAATWSSDIKSKLIRTLTRLSEHEFSRLLRAPLARQLKEIYSGAAKLSATALEGKVANDPRTDLIYQDIYSINTASSSGDLSVRTAAMVKAALSGFCGAAVIQMEDYDYHAKGLDFTDQKDLEAGEAIGRLVEAAHRSQSPVFFQVLTDGGCSAVSGTRNFDADAGDKSMTVVGYYRPGKAPEMRRSQIGNYLDGEGSQSDQGADISTLVGSDTDRVAGVVFANYLNVCGQIGRFEELNKISAFRGEKIDDYLFFA